MGRPLGRIGRWLLAPAGWFSLTLGVVPVLLPLLLATRPGFYGRAGWRLLGLAWLCLLFIQILHALTRLAVALAFRQRPPRHLLGWDRWWRSWAVITIASIGITFAVPLKVAFHFARPEMEQFVREFGDDHLVGARAADACRAGIYTFHRSSIHKGIGGVIVFPLGGGAFIYNPDGWYMPNVQGHLSGPWYWENPPREWSRPVIID